VRAKPEAPAAGGRRRPHPRDLRRVGPRGYPGARRWSPPHRSAWTRGSGEPPSSRWPLPNQW